jgi:hypothetical protein
MTDARGCVRFHIRSREPAFGGARFGAAGAYEKLTGWVVGELDPGHDLNTGIVNLDKAPRNAHGRVEYRVEFCLLTPVEPARDSGWLFYEVLNRGNKLAMSRVNNAAPSLTPNRLEDPGNGFLMRQGHAILWTAWQGDVPASADRMVAEFPIATDGGKPIVGWSRDEIIADAPGSVRDEFIQEISPTRFVATLSYPAASLDVAGASLTVRQKERDPRSTPPGLSWRFLDDRRIEVDRPGGGYDRGAIYEFVYRARDPQVMGIAFPSIRDIVAFLRRDASADNPLAGRLKHTVGFGISQSGRVIRDFVYQGFNQDLDGRPVFDAIMPLVAGSRRTFVNAAFAQPGRYPRQHEDHDYPDDQFPFTYPTLADPISGKRDGILAHAATAGVAPKVMHVDTDSEIWSARASLVVTDCDGNDIAMPEDVRVYLGAGLPHGAANPPTAGVIQNPGNPINFGSLVRALLVALVQWVEKGVEPPPSRFPSRAAGTLLPHPEARAKFPAIPGMAYPAVYNALRLLDHSAVPPHEGREYPVFIATTDADGNGDGGVRHPLLIAPVATHTGWNLRAKGYGEGELYSIVGSMRRFAATTAERQQTGDPRPSLEERYATRDAWVERLCAATAQLVADHLLLPEDAEALRAAAQRSWDVFNAI